MSAYCKVRRTHFDTPELCQPRVLGSRGPPIAAGKVKAVLEIGVKGAVIAVTFMKSKVQSFSQRS
jgi:hypothetical protein